MYLISIFTHKYIYTYMNNNYTNESQIRAHGHSGVTLGLGTYPYEPTFSRLNAQSLFSMHKLLGRLQFIAVRI